MVLLDRGHFTHSLCFPKRSPLSRLKPIPRFSSNIRKAALVERLHQHLLDPATQPRLSVRQQQILNRVAAAGGQLSERHLFLSQAPTLSDLNHLLALGLLFKSGDDLLFMPVELLPPAAAAESPPSNHPPPDPAERSWPPVDVLGYDLTCLLALLQRDPVRLLHGRWLPPGFLKAWGRYCRIPPAQPQARSELQTKRRRFLHYLAESAGLVNDNQLLVNSKFAPAADPSPISNYQLPLTPAPAAWLWLRAPRAERIEVLWQAWQSLDPGRWRRFRLPGCTWLSDPAALLEPVQSAMVHLNPADPALFARTLLEQQPRLLDLLPAATLAPAELLAETIVDIITGPLAWLGGLRQARPERSRRDEAGRPVLSYVAGMKDESISDSSFILRSDDNPPPVAKFALRSSLQADPFQSTFTLTALPGWPDPIDLMVVIEISKLITRAGGKAAFIVQPSSFSLALHHGWSPPALLAALTRLVERPLTAEEVEQLRLWIAAAQKVALKQVVLLESIDPQVITRLASNRRGRNLIQRTLSPRAVVVDAAKIPQLVKRLTEQEGVPPQSIIDNEQYTHNMPNDDFENSKTNPVQPSSLIPSTGLRTGPSSGLRTDPSSGLRTGPSSGLRMNTQPANAAYLWLAVNVYQALGRYISLPGRIPQTVIDQLTPALTPADMAAAEVMVDKTAAAVRRLIDGHSPFPAWPTGGHPIEESLAAIKQAMAAGQDVELLYYAAGTDRLTRRIVEPYRVEWHGGRGAGEQEGKGAGEQASKGERPSPPPLLTPAPLLNSPSPHPRSASGTPYLIGFCHRAQAERMFRLDRIKEISVVPPGQSVV